MRHPHTNHFALVSTFFLSSFFHISLFCFIEQLIGYKPIASRSFVFNIILVFACTSTLIQLIRYQLLAVEFTMAPHKGLRARTLVSGILENKSLLGSSLSRPLSPGDHSLLLAFSRQSPQPSPSRPSLQTPLLQNRNSTNSAFAIINLGLTNTQKTCLFEIEMENSKYQMRQTAAAANQIEKL